MAYSLRSTRNQAAYEDALATILTTNDNGTIHGTGRGGAGRGCNTVPTWRTDHLPEDNMQRPQDDAVRGHGHGHGRAEVQQRE